MPRPKLFSEFISCMIFGSLVSNSRLYSYLMSSFRLSTDGFLSSDLSAPVLTSAALFVMRPWPRVGARETFPSYPRPALTKRSFSLFLSRGDTAPLTWGSLPLDPFPLSWVFAFWLFVILLAPVDILLPPIGLLIPTNLVPWLYWLFLSAEWFRLIESRTIF